MADDNDTGGRVGLRPGRPPEPSTSPAEDVRVESAQRRPGAWLCIAIGVVAVVLLVRRLGVFGSEAVPFACGCAVLVVLVGSQASVGVFVVRRPQRALTVGAASLVLLGAVAAPFLGRHPLCAVVLPIVAAVAAGTALLWDPADPAISALGPGVGLVISLLAAAAVGATVGVRMPWTELVPAVQGAAIIVGHFRRGRGAGGEPAITVELGTLVPFGLAIALAAVLGTAMLFLAYARLHPPVPFGADIQHAQNIGHILRTGHATADVSTADYYPRTFWYWAASVAVAAHLTTFTLLKALVPVLWALSTVNLAILGAVLLGRRVALVAVALYALCSLQPKQTVLDGIDIGVLSEYTLMPLALLATYVLLTRRTQVSAVVWAICVGCLVQVHFLAFSRFALVAVPLVLVALVADPMLRAHLKLLAAAIVGAAIVGLPYTVRYITIYVGFITGALGMTAPSDHAASYPAITFPTGFAGVLGPFVLVGGVVAAVCWLVVGASGGVPTLTWWLLTLWVALVGGSVMTGVLLVPDRDLRSLAVPLAVLGAWLVDAVAGIALRHHGAVISALTCVAILSATPGVERRTLALAQTEVYASAATLRFLGSVPWSELQGRLATDETGIWASYFAGAGTLVLQGGPGGGFESFGEPLRTEMATAWRALHPCTARSAEELRSVGVRYVFAGPPPNHYELPGYVFLPGDVLRRCPFFRVVKQDVGADDYLFAVG